jgi:hypothetical protein
MIGKRTSMQQYGINKWLKSFMVMATERRHDTQSNGAHHNDAQHKINKT